MVHHVAIVGAGPAGASLAQLLAHRGTEVTLVERQHDFSREFRGEMLMPSGIDALEALGLGDSLSEIPTFEIEEVAIYLGGRALFAGDLDPELLGGRRPKAVSQPALLETLVAAAGKSSNFRFERSTIVKDLLVEGGRVVGVRAKGEDGEKEIRADLVIGADGRSSVVRRLAGLSVAHEDPPMDIVWCKLPCPEDFRGGQMYVGGGHLLIGYRSWDDCLQMAWVILKGTFGELRSRGIEEWVEEMARHVSPDLAAHLRAHVDAIDKPFLLSTASDCVDRWSAPGVLVVGDAAHTMSPVGAQGINIALRDAIVAANHLVPVLTESDLDLARLDAALDSIEKDRMSEVAPIQDLQRQPPKIMLSRAWWGEPLRQVLAQLVKLPFIQEIARRRLMVFPAGVTDVDLRV